MSISQKRRLTGQYPKACLISAAAATDPNVLPPIDLLEQETLDDDEADWIADGLKVLAVAIVSVEDDDDPLTV